jgi:hypothetical protein
VRSAGGTVRDMTVASPAWVPAGTAFDATEHLMLPGEDWVMPSADQVNWLAQRLRAAHDRVRRWGPALA